VTDRAPGTQHRFSSALKWAFVMNSGIRVTGLVTTFVLAGILGPFDFGLASMAMVYIAVLQVFLDAGVPAAVIQREHLEERHLDSAFWMTVAWCILLAGFAFGTAGVWASINGEPDLKPVIQVLSIWLVIMGLTIVQQAVLRREMRFKPLAMRANVGALAGAGVGIGLAVAGYGVWALVAEQIATALVGLVLLWAVSDWRPRFRFSRRHARDLLGFSVQGLLGDLGGYIGRRADYLLIGIFLGPTVVGLYRLADRLVDGVLSVTTTPVGTVSLSHFSRLQSDAAGLRRAVLGSVRATSLMNVPSLLLLAGSATAVTALLGSKWLPAADALKILAVVGIAKALTILVSPLLYALARLRLRLVVIWSLTTISVGAFAITGIALQNEPLDVQVIWTAASRGVLFALVFVPVSLFVLARFGGVRLSELGQTFVTPGIAGVAGGLVAFGLSDSGVLDHLHAIPALLVVAAAGGGVTLGLLLALDESVRTRSVRIVQRVRRRTRVQPTVGGAT
jgi:O-antigen/teichoic acid export membrane protein